MCTVSSRNKSVHSGFYLVASSFTSGDMLCWEHHAGFIQKCFQAQGSLLVQCQKPDLVSGLIKIFFQPPAFTISFCPTLNSQEFFSEIWQLYIAIKDSKVQTHSWGRTWRLSDDVVLWGISHMSPPSPPAWFRFQEDGNTVIALM